MASRSAFIGHLASFSAYAIWGLNIVFCKDIANESGLSPLTLFSFRAVSAAALFWLIGLACPSEHVPPRDLLRMCGASFLGLITPQLTFLYAIAMAAPIDISVVQSVTPIMTMFVAALFLKEPITWKKALGVAVSFGGVLWLILQSVGASSVGQSSPWGIALALLNSTSFACYLGLCRPVIQRYSVVTLMKWMFLFAAMALLPFSWEGMVTLNYAAVPAHVWWEIAYLVLFATCAAYFLVPVGQQRIRPTLVSMYGYLQPIIAAGVGIAVGMDRLTWMKASAVILVFAGVFIVNRSRAAATPKP